MCHFFVSFPLHSRCATVLSVAWNASDVCVWEERLEMAEVIFFCGIADNTSYSVKHCVVLVGL